MMWTLARTMLDALLPAHCMACNEMVEQNGLLCEACFKATDFITDPVCRHCGLPLEQDNGLCTGCDWDPPRFRAARAALRYGPGAKRLILPFKYSDRPEAARGLAKMMMRPGAAMLAQADFLAPVPLHRRRLAQRGYNQAGLLAGALGHWAQRPVLIDALARIRATPALASLDHDARAQWMQGAIAVRAHRRAQIEGKIILLIDDVLTSGATASACADALLASGAAAVDVLALARVADERADEDYA
ncbi:MAG TPA: ComF family protein [Acidiphilium sp.]|nr:MAG: phosphoribosyltransferase [Acidiphilium sp. 21-60-14]OYV90926.1 MAG: phosphoribosyltransferase [Acidiphilium sp. 37-60-79]HQT88273.1 ComF family protein [Acidiphilium sp.]HQU23322.1 ComF family protein [Acidiphilium sp.]